MRKIFIGADHAGYSLKETLKHYLEEKGYSIEDMGNIHLDPDDDYVDFASSVAKRVANTPESTGILVCDTGSGMSITANKFRGIRAVNAWNKDVAKYAREHNYANIVCFGETFVSSDAAKEILEIWLNTDERKEDRHIRRVGKIESINDLMPLI